MTELAAPAAATSVRPVAGWFRGRTGYLAALGLLVMTVADNTVLYRSWEAHPIRTLVISAVIAAPFIAAAIVLTGAATERTTAAVVLFTAAAGASIISGTAPFWQVGQTLHGWPWVAAGLLGLTGWLILTARPAATFALLVPLALFTYAWDVNHWVFMREGDWLHHLGMPYPNGFGPSATTVIYGLWGSLDLTVAAALAALAALISRLARQGPALRGGGTYAAPAAQFGNGYAQPDSPRPYAAPPGSYAPSGPYGPVPGAGAPTNGTAIAALVCGILGMFVFFPAALAAVICGHVARGRIRRTGEGGSGLALAGLVLGYIGLLIVAALVIAFVVIVVAAGRSSS